MNIKDEIGTIFYRVGYQGVMSKYEIVRYKNNKPVYNISTLTNLRNEEYKLIENPKVFGTSNFSLDVVINKPDEYFISLEKAKQKSLERFEKEVNPNGKYKVARYFDDVFEAYVTGELSKKEARSKAQEFNRRPRHYVSYGIVDVK